MTRGCPGPVDCPRSPSLGDIRAISSCFSRSTTSSASLRLRAEASSLILSMRAIDVATPTSAEMRSSSSSSQRDSSSCRRCTMLTMRESQDSRLFLRPSWTFSRLPSSLLNMSIHHSTGIRG